MVSGAGAAEHEAAKVAEGIIAREAREVLREAEQVGGRDAAQTVERDAAARAEREAADRAEQEAAERAAAARLEHTNPSHEPGQGTVTGRETRVNLDDPDPRNVRALQLENETPQTLRDHGFDTHQNPSKDEIADAAAAHGDTVRSTAKPDYLIEGKVFDHYAPGPGKPVRGIATEVADKVLAEQTQRVVVNLKDWNGSLAALQKQFTDWPVSGLKELMVVQPDGSYLNLLGG